MGELRSLRRRRDPEERTAVIVSNAAADKFLNRVQVVPLTSSVERLYPSEAHVTFQRRQGKALADQVTTVSKLRLIDRAGTPSHEEMQRVGKALRTQLDL